MSFLSNIITVAKPVALIAAQVLEQLPQAGEKNEASLSLVDFIPDAKDSHEIFAVNNLNTEVTLTFQHQYFQDGAYGVQSESAYLPSRKGADVTAKTAYYTNDGTVSANYTNGSQSDPAAPTTRMLTLTLPYLAAMKFTTFSESITIERTEVPVSGGGTVSRWSLAGSSKLSSVLFDYTSKEGEKIYFKTKLDNPQTGPAGDFKYDILMDEEGQATGVLTDFTIIIEALDSELPPRVSAVPIIPFEELPPNVRARIRIR